MEYTYVAFFGRRNAGKSSLMNAVTGQAVSLVSDVPGTTADPVSKAMELPPLGPVMLIDTAGMDDSGALGSLRAQRTRELPDKIDLGVLVIDAAVGITQYEREWRALFSEKGIAHLTVYNKCDLAAVPSDGALAVSAKTGEGIGALKEAIAAACTPPAPPSLVEGIISEGDHICLVIPIDASAPKDRIILPQQQAIRAILDRGAFVTAVRENELAALLERMAPDLVITDSSVFGSVYRITKGVAPLTSFSILLARQKGLLGQAVEGVRALDRIADGDRILIAEGCTHHRQCEDIGTVKLPKLIRAFTKAEPQFSFCSGKDFPKDLSPFCVIIHCGGCMLSQNELLFRRRAAAGQQIPMTNYGIAIAYMKGILSPALAPFAEFDEEVRKKLDFGADL